MIAVNSKSVVGIKPSDSGVVTEYSVVKFTCTSLVEPFVAQSHIHSGFIEKVSKLTAHLNHGVSATNKSEVTFGPQYVPTCVGSCFK